MISKFIEATDKHEFNWGKFAVCRFDKDEWARRSHLDGKMLLKHRGWSPDFLFVIDLQTGEGAMFRPSGYARADLDKHKVWVCPMFEPFLHWLYQQDVSDIGKLPEFVNLGDVPTAMYGYRRKGKQEEASAKSEVKRAKAVADGFCYSHPTKKRESHHRYCDACLARRLVNVQKYRDRQALTDPPLIRIDTKLMGEHWRATDGTTAMWGATEGEAVARLKAKLDDTP